MFYFQRHHFELKLLDEKISIPSQPYMYMQHQTYVHETIQKEPDHFHALMEEYVKGKFLYIKIISF